MLAQYHCEWYNNLPCFSFLNAADEGTPEGMTISQKCQDHSFLKDLSEINRVNGVSPETDPLEISEKEGIPLRGTTESYFEITGKLYKLLADNK